MLHYVQYNIYFDPLLIFTVKIVNYCESKFKKVHFIRECRYTVKFVYIIMFIYFNFDQWRSVMNCGIFPTCLIKKKRKRK